MTCPKEHDEEGWGAAKIRQCWLDEIESRFELENANYRQMEEREIEAAMASGKLERLPAHLRKPRDSSLYEIWKACEITHPYANQINVLLPGGYAYHRNLVTMFDHTEVDWSQIMIDACIINDRPRIRILATLIDYWDDERCAEWHAEHPELHPDVAAVVERYLPKPEGPDYLKIYREALAEAQKSEN